MIRYIVGLIAVVCMLAAISRAQVINEAPKILVFFEYGDTVYPMIVDGDIERPDMTGGEIVLAPVQIDPITGEILEIQGDLGPSYIEVLRVAMDAQQEAHRYKLEVEHYKALQEAAKQTISQVNADHANTIQKCAVWR